MAGKILLLSDIFPPKTGGSGRWFREIYSRLPRERVLVAAGTGAGTEEFDRTHDLDIMRLPLEMRTRGIRGVANVKHYWRLSAQIRRIVKERGISSIHCARNLPEGFMAWMVRQRTGVKYTCYVHGEDVGVSATSRELAWMTCRVFAGATRVIANSNNTRESFNTKCQCRSSTASESRRSNATRNVNNNSSSNIRNSCSSNNNSCNGNSCG